MRLTSKISILASVMGLYIAVSLSRNNRDFTKMCDAWILNLQHLVYWCHTHFFFFWGVKLHFLLLRQHFMRKSVTSSSGREKRKGELILINLIFTKSPFIVLYFALNLLLQDVGFKKKVLSGFIYRCFFSERKIQVKCNLYRNVHDFVVLNLVRFVV